MKLPSDKNHPLYDTIKSVILMVCMTIVLAINANDFDETELKALGMMLLLVIGGQVGWKAAFEFLKRVKVVESQEERQND